MQKFDIQRYINLTPSTRQRLLRLTGLAILAVAITSVVNFPADLYVYMAFIGLVGIVAGNMFSFFAVIIAGVGMTLQHFFKSGDFTYIPTSFAFLILMMGVVWVLTRIRDKEAQSFEEIKAALEAEIVRRQNAENQQNQSDVNYKTLLEAVPAAVLVFCFTDTRRLYSNRAALKLFRVHTEDELPEYLRDFKVVSSADEEELERRIAQYKNENVTTLPATEYALIVYDSVVYVRSQSQLIDYGGTKAVIVMMTDITQSRRAEKALRESEERYRVITEMSQSAIVVFSQPEQKILYNNAAWSRLVQAENMPHLNVAELIQIGDQSEEYSVIMQQFNKSGVAQGETEIQTIHGQRLRVDISAAKILFEGREAALLIINDVTERHHARQLKVELEKERQIRALRDGFVAMMSHEFRTPLAVIQSSIDIFDKYSDRLTEERRKYHLQKVRDQIQHMVAMIDDLLLLSRANAGMLEFKPNKTDLAQIIKDHVAEFSDAKAHDHRVSMVITGNFSGVYVDGDLIRHIMTNLLGNAAKYAPVGTNIGVELVRKGDFAQLSVTDEGIGIPPETPDLFAAFVRGSNVGAIQGTGMGLAIVKTSAEQHGGSATYKSQPGRTTFTVTLRVMPATPAMPDT